MDELRQDVRYAIRSLVRRPGFTLTAFAILALGVGINTAMFSVVRGVLLEPLPYAAPEALVRAHHVHQEGGASDGLFSPPDFEDFAQATTSFARLAAYWHAPGLSRMTLSGAGEAALLESAYVSDDFFATLGVPPLRGRLPAKDEMVEGNDRFVVLSHALWRMRFGADPAIVGSAITLNNGPYIVLGVMPPAFAYPAPEVEAWLPLSLITDEMIPRQRGLRYLGLVGRLAPGIAEATAATELSGIAARLAEAHPQSNEGWHTVRLQGMREAVLGPVRAPLVVLAGAVAFVLLIGCANLVNLLLARATARQNEFALRSALGARPGRLVRQIVTESTVLAVAGGIAGIVLAVWLTDTLVALAAAELPRTQNIRLDGVVLGFGLLLALVAGVLTGLVPALRTTVSSAATLREGGRGMTDGAQRQRLRGTLIAAEMALAAVLVIAAGLMVRSLVELMRVEPGFHAANVLAVSLTVPPQRYPNHWLESVAYRNELIERVGGLAGVERVAVAKTAPLEGGGEPFEFTLPARDGAVFGPEAGAMIVSPEYFAALGIPVRRGRTFDEREMRAFDGSGGELMQLSMVINEAAARRHFPGEDAVGQHVLLGNTPIEIIGVVGDVRHAGLHAPPPAAAYMPIDLMPRLSLRLLVQVQGDPRRLIGPVRDAIRELEPGQPIAEIVPLADTISRAAARERFLTTLLGGFAALALLLAALGIYGVVAYSVTQRLNEIGIRMALGADRTRVVRMVITQSAVWWGLGLIGGIAAAFVASRLLQGLVYGVSVTDPLTFAGVALLLCAAALLASALPAWRASRVEPTRAFRSQ
jgi:predicted permease